MDDLRLRQLEKSIEEIKESQHRIANALLGSFENQSVGLIEETRTLRRDVNYVQATLQTHSDQIEDVVSFKKKIKLIVAAIAVIIPFSIELIKITFGSFFNLFKH